MPGRYRRLPQKRVDELDEHDRIARRVAYRAGHSHVLAVGEARTRHGKAIGHVRA